VDFLRKDHLLGPSDALFPKPLIGLQDGGFACLGLSRDTYSSAGKILDVIKSAFIDAGLTPFGPHSFLKTLEILANKFCKTPEQFNAWSMNLGHENIANTLSA
jgi:integrase/recombinase XerD